MARKQAVRRNKPPTPGWVWLLGGALIGALIAVVVMLSGGLPGDRDQWQGPRPSAGTGQEPDQPPKPQDEETTKRDYDFYNVLPEMEVVIPKEELSQRADERDPVASDPNASYLLQAGSFRNNADADRLKAKLALQGYQARIQTVTVDQTTWHRVRLGPFENARAADQARRRLEDAGIRTIALKVKS